MICGIFSPLTSAELVRKVVSDFRKQSCVSTGVRNLRKHICVTNCHDINLAVKVALNPNTTNQPTNQ